MILASRQATVGCLASVTSCPYLAAGREVWRVRKLRIEQPRSPEGPLQATWPLLRRAALTLSGALGGAAVGN